VNAEPSPTERARVAELLGREPQGRYTIAARDDAGDPTVIRNEPFLADGTPMPTTFWLIGPDWVRRIGQLEAAGGVDGAEAAVDPEELAAAHARYAAMRDSMIADDHTGPRPSGGVGGTRTGVKCLHAHWAWHLAGGDDPVGRWIAERIDATTGTQLDGVRIDLTAEATRITLPTGTHATLPWGYTTLTATWFADHDPPPPANLTNALGMIDDDLHDVDREHPEFAQFVRGGEVDVSFMGPTITSLARLERGVDDAPPAVTLDRADAEDVFRLVATESAAERAHNPGLPSRHVDSIVATCCVVLSVMRRYHLDQVTLLTGAAEGE
jgi:hypothetical protein